MRILLVTPANPPSYWTYDAILPTLDVGCLFPNLSMPTVAGLTPAEHEVVLCDENVEEIDFDFEADIVGVTGFIVHRGRILVVDQRGDSDAEAQSRAGLPGVDLRFSGKLDQAPGSRGSTVQPRVGQKGRELIVPPTRDEVRCTQSIFEEARHGQDGPISEATSKLIANGLELPTTPTLRNNHWYSMQWVTRRARKNKIEMEKVSPMAEL